MSTVRYAAFLAITLLLQSRSAAVAAANFTIPFLSPFFGDNACKENLCGKGNCVTTNNSTFGFECQCEHGWKQARSQDDDFLAFLPCVVPNCTLNYTCAKSPTPPPDNQNRSNLSFFDPCFWTSCGGGSCNKTSLFTHACVCEQGYYNLFNSSAFPCYNDCAIGMDCANLGLNIGNSSTSTPPKTPTSDDDSSYGESLIPRVEFGWLITIMTSLALFLSKL
ncbi:hypothetical protein ABFX02_07G035700 [Erythranthe guttata]